MFNLLVLMALSATPTAITTPQPLLNFLAEVELASQQSDITLLEPEDPAEWILVPISNTCIRVDLMVREAGLHRARLLMDPIGSVQVMGCYSNGWDFCEADPDEPDGPPAGQVEIEVLNGICNHDGIEVGRYCVAIIDSSTCGTWGTDADSFLWWEQDNCAPGVGGAPNTVNNCSASGSCDPVPTCPY